MTGTAAIPLHLAVHLVGLAVAAALAAHAATGRRAIGPGWGALAVGAAFLAASHVLAGAVVTGAAGWVVYLRVAGYAGVAVGAAGGIRPVAAAAVLPVVVPTLRTQVVLGVAGLAAAVAALRGVLGPGGALFAAGIVLWAAADVLAGTVAWAPVVASVAGSVLVGAWLLTRARTSLLASLASAFVGALLLLVLGLAGLSGVVFGADLERDELAALDAAAASRVAEVETDWTESMLTVSRLFAQQTLAAALVEGDEARLERLAMQIAELPDTDIVALLDAEGRLVASYEWTVEPVGPLARSDALALTGDDLVASARVGSSRGLVLLGDRDVVAVGATAVHPFEDGVERRDELAGTIVAGRRVADPVFVGRVAQTSDADVSIIVAGRLATSTLPATAAADVPRAAAETAGGAAVVPLAGGATFLAAHPLTPDGTALLVLSRDAAAFAAAVERVTRTLFLIAVAGLAAAFALAAWASRRLARPLVELTATAERIAAGERDVRTSITRPDEVGRLAAAFDHMTVSLVGREQELRRAALVEAGLRERLEVLTESMEEALVAVGTDGRIQTVNPAAARLLGLADTAGVAAGDVRIDDVLTGVDEAGVDLLEALGRPGSAGVRSTRGMLERDGRSVPVAATAAPLRSEDSPGRVYVLRDVTGEHQVERMKTEFLSNISHELRTPLTPIKGYAEVLRRRKVPPERVPEFATQIVDATARLERIIGMLVDFAALEAGRVHVNLRPTTLGEVVDDVLEEWRDRMPDRRFSRRLARGLPAVHADPRLLSRMLEELIDNAVKFSDGPVRLRARADGGERNGVVRLTVADDGAGIDPEELRAITDDFRQVDGSSTRQYGGLGLGLSLVSRIAERLDARIVVRSEEGDGTEVDLLLPVAEGTTS